MTGIYLPLARPALRDDEHVSIRAERLDWGNRSIRLRLEDGRSVEMALCGIEVSPVDGEPYLVIIDMTAGRARAEGILR
ncbi:hypothetical protein [Azorhizobium doebereinerae]|uniref:hypothetical protein n=1 Tax=Azorhizobium doebereinerae TaxID=281091 RepID=UPI000420EA5C|nr:hypothetical protein [Azorhizobium doebereinerae]